MFSHYITVVPPKAVSMIPPDELLTPEQLRQVETFTPEQRKVFIQLWLVSHQSVMKSPDYWSMPLPEDPWQEPTPKTLYPATHRARRARLLKYWAEILALPRFTENDAG